MKCLAIYTPTEHSNTHHYYDCIMENDSKSHIFISAFIAIYHIKTITFSIIFHISYYLHGIQLMLKLPKNVRNTLEIHMHK